MARSSTTFKKGEAKGRPPGVENKTTRDIKEAFKMLIEANIPNLTIWLEKVGNKSPEKALHIVSELSEYVIPKKSRIDHTSEDGSMSPKISISPIEWSKPNDENKQ